MRVSIIIPAFNKVEITARCLNAIWENTPQGLYDLCLINNGCNDKTENLFEETAKRLPVTIIQNFTNHGCTLAYHQGAQACSESEFILFLNNDMEVEKGWLEPLFEMMGNKEVGIVGPKLVFPKQPNGLPGRLQEAGSVVFQDGSTYSFGFGDDPERPCFNSPCEVDFVSCALIRNSVFKAFGGIDTQYSPAYYEDVDVCFSMRKQGYKVMYEPRSCVRHLRGATIGHHRLGTENQKKFCGKWKEELLWQGTPLALGGNPLSTADRSVRLQRTTRIMSKQTLSAAR